MRRAFVILLVVALGACASNTQITGSWKNSQQTKTYNNILVAALSNNVGAKSTVENDLAAALSSKGVSVLKSTDVFPPTITESSPDKETLIASIKENGADAILTISLIDEQTETRYVPGSALYEPIPRFGYYGMFWGYYSFWQPRMMDPGYYAEDKVYFIETNLYDADTEKMIWSAQSQTYNPSDLTSFSAEFSRIIAAELDKNGLLGKEAIVKQR